MKAATRTELEARIAALEAERDMIRRHVATLCRATRRALNDNRELRVHKHTLIRYIEACAP